MVTTIPSVGVLLDRETLIAEVEGFLEAPGQRVLVAQGLRGVGKTSIAAKIVNRSKQRFDDVFWLRCEPDRASPDIVLEELSTFLDRNNDESLRRLWQEQSDNRLKVCADALVEALTRRQYLLVFDDLEQWLDEAGRIGSAPLRHIFTRLAAGNHRSKCILLTERRLLLDPTGVTLPFGAVIEQDVLGLPEEHATDLLRQSGLAELNEEALRRIVDRYSGNPRRLRLFAHLVVREHRSVEEVLAGEVDDLLDQVLERLGPTASAALEPLAVFRRPVPRASLDQLGIEFDRDVTVLHGRFLLDIVPRSGAVILPADVRRRVLGRLRADHIRELHESAASHYAGRARVERPRQLSDLEPVLEEAFHRGEAGMWSASALLVSEVGDDLLRLGYVDVAEWHVRRLLPHLEDRRHRASCGLLLGRVEDWRSSYDEATRAFEQALADARGVDASAVAESQYRIGRIMTALSRFDQADRWLTACIQTCEQASLGRPMAGALVSLAWGRAQRGTDTTATLKLYDRALQVARDAGDHHHESLAHRQIGFLQWDKLEDMDRSRKHYDEALRISRDHDDLKEAAALLTELAYLRNEWGDPVGAAADCRKAIETCQTIGNRYTLANAYWNQGWIHESTAELEQALESFGQSVELYRLTRNESGLASAWLRIGAVRRRIGDLGGAGQALEESESLCRKHRLVELLTKVRDERQDLERDVASAEEAAGEDTATPEHFTYIEHQEVHMGHDIQVGGHANINIDSVLIDVTQSIDAAPALDPAQQSVLKSLVTELQDQMSELRAEHEAECQEITAALEKAVAEATKEKRSKKLLEFSADGLKRAAELVSEMAPTLLTTAGKIAAFIVGLV